MRGVRLLFGASGLMVLGFLVNIIIDYQRYKVSFTSAPFWLWICVDALVWLIPALLAYIAGCVAKKKLRKKENAK